MENTANLNRGDLPRRCINCSFVVPRSSRVQLHSLDELTNSTLNILRSWIAPSSLTRGSILCGECHTLLVGAEATTHGGIPARQIGHKSICYGCGRSTTRVKTYRVAANADTRNVILRWVPLHQVSRLERVCGPCWQAATKDARRSIRAEDYYQHETEAVIPQPPAQPAIPQPPPLPAPLVDDAPRPVIPKINSANYKRAAATSRHCIFEGCVSRERLMIPQAIRDMCLLYKRIYVPISARVCRDHLNRGSWFDLTAHLNDFSASQFDAILKTFENAQKHAFNFENVNLMASHMCHYWLGRTAEEFEELLLCVPSLAQFVKNPSVALCIYLVKLRTGESNDRLATLFQLPRSTLEKKMSFARQCLIAEFVQSYLGFEHMDAEQVAARNTRIPDGLFGNPILPVDVKPAIVMCDATYIYIQSSTNYKFQKDTYSLQKSDNLVKPFMVVCCDGYIIDCMGPYKATTNDASITRNDLVNDQSKLREFFRQGDIFILDRGFRDVIQLLVEMGFEAKMPESLLDGEHQLTTLQANKTRFVTMCRWVVEVLNGRIKRDFRIFRNVFNNRSIIHLKDDIRVVCALTNKFHKLIEDPPEANEIVEVAQMRLNLNNYLADFVFSEDVNMNRRRAEFTAIDGDHPHLSGFPMLTLQDLKMLALGTYQIKQARSYYGEHIRATGNYDVEINNNIDDDVPLILGLNNYLIRGRVKSRHVGGRTYFIYILISRDLDLTNTLDAIKGYCCNCLVGRRTVGCCAHTMTIVWYLSWGRYNDITAPAPFLDNFFEEDI